MTTKKPLALKDYLGDISETDRLKIFNDNYLDIIDRLHPDLPQRYKVDFVQQAMLAGADPRKKQIHLTTYFSKKLGHKVGVPVFSYHFFLNQANQTGEYGGIDVNTDVEEVFDPIQNKEVRQLVSTATVFRKGAEKPTTFKARWSECYNAKNGIWKDRPYQMLEKTAIANALRWAFPETLSNMFIEEEIREEHVEKVVTDSARENDEEKATERLEASKVRKAEALVADDKEGIIKTILEQADVATAGLDIPGKIDYFQKELGIDHPADLQEMSISSLKELIRE